MGCSFDTTLLQRELVHADVGWRHRDSVKKQMLYCHYSGGRKQAQKARKSRQRVFVCSEGEVAKGESSWKAGSILIIKRRIRRKTGKVKGPSNVLLHNILKPIYAEKRNLFFQVCTDFLLFFCSNLAGLSVVGCR